MSNDTQLINYREKQEGQPPTTERRGYLKRCLFGLAIMIGLAVTACSQGSYPVDIFYEMHYQQSYKSHEPPRISAPASSVAWYPGPRSTSFNDGQHLYTVNCSMCHGVAGKGDGPVLRTLINKYDYKTAADPDLTSDLVKSFDLSVIEGFMMSGIVVMPSFAKLLSADERKAIIDYINNTLQQQ